MCGHSPGTAHVCMFLLLPRGGPTATRVWGGSTYHLSRFLQYGISARSGRDCIQVSETLFTGPHRTRDARALGLTAGPKRVEAIRFWGSEFESLRENVPVFPRWPGPLAGQPCHRRVLPRGHTQ